MEKKFIKSQILSIGKIFNLIKMRFILSDAKLCKISVMPLSKAYLNPFIAAVRNVSFI